jgi:N-acetylmuramoyl-L-alanine amidase
MASVMVWYVAGWLLWGGGAYGAAPLASPAGVPDGAAGVSPAAAATTKMISGAPVLTASGARLSVLGREPDWTQLEQYQGTMTREDFTRLLDTVYAPGGAWKGTIEIGEIGASILTTGSNRWVLHFAREGKKAREPERYWKPISRLPLTQLPLSGVTIALDPGHLGAEWAKMEERWFQMGADTVPVAEGDMTLLTARLLAAKLKARGADVVFVRNDTEPLTKLRPEDLRDAAREQLKRQGIGLIREDYNGAADPLRMNSVKWTSELLFYRIAEIQERARLVNEKLQPDMVLCLHYNAEAWGDPAKPTLVNKDHMHVMVNGCYSAQELMLDDVRYAMLMKLLTRCYPEELTVAEHVADDLAEATGLPPYEYTQGNAKRVGDDPYVWARNLLANRVYQCPVIYIEPYVMNSPEVWARVQAGNYEGLRMVAGKMRQSIYREYASAVAQGVVDAARELRR